MEEPPSILVVEDDLGMREILVETLEEEEYVVRSASSVDEALSLTPKFSFDILVTDIRMAGPDGVEGFVLLKSKLPKLRCICITGYLSDDVSRRAVEVGVDDFVFKPFHLVDISSAVYRLVHGKSLKSYYYDLVNKLPVKMVIAVTNFFTKDKNVTLNKARNRAFQSLYISIKSQYTDATSANIIYSALLKNERDYIGHLEEPNESVAGELVHSYNDIHDRLSSLAQSKRQLLGKPEIPVTEFRHFFDLVKKNKISPDQFQMSAELRRLSKAQLRQAPELLEMKELMWPDVVPAPPF